MKPNTHHRFHIARFFAGLALATAAVLTVSSQQEFPATAAALEIDGGNLRAYIELARSDVRIEKATIIAENIAFTADEAFEFWPLHREYTLELDKLLDERLLLIGRHISQFDDMSDKEARDLADDVFDLEQKRLKLKRTWFKKFAKVIPAKKAAQFFQLENQLNAVVDLRVAAMMPLIK